MTRQSDPGPSLPLPAVLAQVHSALPNQAVHLVGGAVRDLLLGRPVHDYDFALPANGIKAARRVADLLHGAFYALDDVRDTGRVLVTLDGATVCMDFATYRGLGENGTRPGLDEDLRGRDFTLNAIALDLHTSRIHDPLRGARDLKDRHLRMCSPTSIADDPIRILRAVRLAQDLGCRMEPDLTCSIKQSAPQLVNISGERLRDELFRILEGPAPAACLRILDALGALPPIFPELGVLRGLQQPQPHVHDVWDHTLSAVGHMTSILGALQPEYDPEQADDLLNGLLVLHLGRYRDQITARLGNTLNPGRSARGLLFLEVLLHDIAKPVMQTVQADGRIRFLGHDQAGAELASLRAHALALSNLEIERLAVVIRSHMRLLTLTTRRIAQGELPTRRAVYRFFRDTSEAGVDICLLALADMRATYEQSLRQEDWTACLGVVRCMLENWFENPLESVRPKLLVDGNDLMRELGIPPGPQVGELLEWIREHQAVGEISTRQQALESARERMSGGSPLNHDE